jgi:hypothetical protein
VGVIVISPGCIRADTRLFVYFHASVGVKALGW